MPPPFRRSPVDCLGYPRKCCNCIPLRAATIIICVLSFLWATAELTQSDEFMETILPDQGVILKYAKAVHIFVIVCFLVSCGVLMLGIIVRRSIPVHIYIWIAFIFNCICLVLIIISTALQVIRTEKITNKTSMKLVLSIIWNSVYFYLISVVNGYKITFFWA